MRPRFLPIFLLALIFIILAGCAPLLSEQTVYSPVDGWKFSDIKCLDGIDNIRPDYDIIAVYSRQVRSKFQIRLDLLEISRDPNLDIHISLNTPTRTARFPGMSRSPEKLFI
jgi:hypothetical protein